MSITTTSIVSQFGAYYKDGGQSVKDLRTKLFQPSETDELFERRITKNTQLEGGNVSIGGVLQGFQKAFTPYGNTTIEGVIIPLYKLKIDVAEYPDDIDATWAGFLAGINELDRKEWPFVRYWLENLVIPRSIEDWELLGIFSGVKGAVTPSTPQSVEYALNGIKKLQNLAIAATTLTPIAVGAVPSDPVDFVDYVESFVDGIPHIYRSYLQPLAMSKANAEKFMRGMDLKYNTNYAQTGNAKVRYSDIQVKGYASHAGSDIIWTTVKGNAVQGIKNPANESVFRVESEDRKVKAYTDYYRGIGYWRYDWVFRNDVETT